MVIGLDLSAVDSHRSPEARIASLALDFMARKVAERQAAFSSDEAVFMDILMDILMDIPRVSPELPYMKSMSEMIDGSETLDWLF
ncbi:Fungal transcriptional regulatory protein, N-terminal [Penicillium digitatum]|uniref:Fungal transcriptional regulatory protein, N-terminal n=1 Tax=Penicillium digitatum TaxID=36651 RepID=A0A7T6XEM3_PENDI|nr:Fungal transcriptional regulatory protein, N-terminal [Penicillium digitatum]